MSISLGIYRKQAILLMAILILVFFSYFGINIYQHSRASEQINIERDYQNTINLELKKSGELVYDGKTIKDVIFPENDYDEFRYLVLDSPGFFIEKLTIVLHLPESSPQVKQIVYAVHGVEENFFYQQDNRTLVYNFREISPSGAITVVANLPKGLVQFSTQDKIVFAVANQLSKVWLYFGLALPIITFLILFLIWFLRWRDLAGLKTRVISKNIPGGEQREPAAIVGVILNGKISSREIAATIVDLARRGYIYIFQKNNGFAFAKGEKYRQNESELYLFEKILLSKIFEKEGFKSSDKDIDQRVGKHIFSRKIAQTYLEIYHLVGRSGYFVEDPSSTQSKYKVFSIIAFLLGLAGFIIGIFWGPKPNFLIYLFAGVILSATGINRFASLMPFRTERGRKMLKQWLAFSNHFSLDKLLELREINQDLLEEYLPYAIVFKKEKEWLKRYGNHPFTPPNWFDSYKKVITIEDFGNNLFSIIGETSNLLTSAREPIID